MKLLSVLSNIILVSVVFTLLINPYSCEKKISSQDVSPNVKIKVLSANEKICVGQNLNLRVEVISREDIDTIKNATIEIQTSSNLILLIDNPVWRGDLGPGDRIKVPVSVKATEIGVGKLSAYFTVQM